MGLLDFLSEIGPGPVDGCYYDPWSFVRLSCINLNFRRAANCANELVCVSFFRTYVTKYKIIEQCVY